MYCWSKYLYTAHILTSISFHFSLVVRKQDYCLCKNKGADQLCSNCTFAFATRIEQCLFFLNPKFLAIFCNCTCQFMLGLVGDRFSCVGSHLSRLVGKPTMWFRNRSDTNQAVQSQKQARDLKFWLEVEEESYYPSSENKGAYQLRGYREADLRLFFSPMQIVGFPMGRLI